jgi:hypothetical protein
MSLKDTEPDGYDDDDEYIDLLGCLFIVGMLILGAAILIHFGIQAFRWAVR